MGPRCSPNCTERLGLVGADLGSILERSGGRMPTHVAPTPCRVPEVEPPPQVGRKVNQRAAPRARGAQAADTARAAASNARLSSCPQSPPEEPNSKYRLAPSGGADLGPILERSGVPSPASTHSAAPPGVLAARRRRRVAPRRRRCAHLHGAAAGAPRPGPEVARAGVLIAAGAPPLVRPGGDLDWGRSRSGHGG